MGVPWKKSKNRVNDIRLEDIVSMSGLANS